MIFVENGYNTCYIDSLLVGLFYTPSIIYNKLLDNDPDDNNFMYLQEIIKNNFIDTLRKNMSITADIINEIRNYSFIYGYPKELLKQQNIIEYFTFITNNMNMFAISQGKPYISINLDQNMCDTDIKTLLNINNIYIDNNNIHNVYMVPIYINRFMYTKRLTTKIDIKRKIKLGDANQRWYIHCIICHVGDNIYNDCELTCNTEYNTNGHYYTILSSGSKWIMFDDMHIPSFKEINMSDKVTIDKIKRECIFIIYKMTY